MSTETNHQAVVSARGVRVEFGAVKALDGIDLAILPGEAIGLVGHNGAGKSTIVNVINGGLLPHQGTISYGGVDGAGGITTARANGVRCVFQELSLCPNLTIVENTRVMHAGLKGFGWRKRALSLIHAKLDEIFPGNHIDCAATVGELSIAERQMVEIAITFAAVTDAPKLVILDEPTSSLDAGLAEQLLAHVRHFVTSGGAVLLISHILGEILSTSSRIVVMKDGRAVTSRPASEFSVHSLVEAMGSVVKERTRGGDKTQKDAPYTIDRPPSAGSQIGFKARSGEIIGLAGLGGHGQTDMLLNLFRDRSGNWLPGYGDAIAFVAGDRALNGTFPLWSILKNLSIGSLPHLSRLAAIDTGRERTLGADWKERMEIRTPDMGNPILSLSGGNQQKVLFARALATKADIVLMDDPMRGVDIGTKQEVYAILRSEAAAGRTFIWYSTEMDEICLCDRVYVFRDGAIVAELTGDEIEEKNVLASSFSGEAA
ncbi:MULTISPECIES: ATP-binding cassette domain-containing protein [Alphaproteobacteria]|uniref:ABC transporter ATP-binding protein n=2 Tax=Alphaproteobacteria TaxID=28211 RepID=A0A512HQ23_9HYPH|nr:MULTISPECIES: sugar ABC transporter ATP-binding protein [Alphaproteobacteria]GEO87529.1 ABC transporter ATP-binding protein [Ciceribacter naphthalenivorans]GLR23682.1 ABC transporter ATP-binding protein [Ciceribacter naphthalenivorans]GLT06538.1 ABC transporter ATP-binding protein [Sphingomonas psychrolutea]